MNNSHFILTRLQYAVHINRKKEVIKNSTHSQIHNLNRIFYAKKKIRMIFNPRATHRVSILPIECHCTFRMSFDRYNNNQMITTKNKNLV